MQVYGTMWANRETMLVKLAAIVKIQWNYSWEEQFDATFCWWHWHPIEFEICVDLKTILTCSDEINCMTLKVEAHFSLDGKLSVWKLKSPFCYTITIHHTTSFQLRLYPHGMATTLVRNLSNYTICDADLVKQLYILFLVFWFLF